MGITFVLQFYFQLLLIVDLFSFDLFIVRHLCSFVSASGVLPSGKLHIGANPFDII